MTEYFCRQLGLAGPCGTSNWLVLGGTQQCQNLTETRFIEIMISNVKRRCVFKLTKAQKAKALKVPNRDSSNCSKAGRNRILACQNWQIKNVERSWEASARQAKPKTVTEHGGTSRSTSCGGMFVQNGEKSSNHARDYRAARVYSKAQTTCARRPAGRRALGQNGASCATVSQDPTAMLRPSPWKCNMNRTVNRIQGVG